MLIINADDYGVNRDTTERTILAFKASAVTSASLMVFMEDTEFASEQAKLWGLDTGLHLNFTASMTGTKVDSELIAAQEEVSRYLMKSKLSQLLYNPALAKQFRYIYTSQMNEFIRLFNREPSHIDGHHHMHLCANAIWGDFYPRSGWVRRNFTFSPGKKGYLKWIYRQTMDKWLSLRFRTTEYFDSIEPVEERQRLLRLFQTASRYLVELEVHPAREQELNFLTSTEFHKLLGDTKLTSFAALF